MFSEIEQSKCDAADDEEFSFNPGLQLQEQHTDRSTGSSITPISAGNGKHRLRLEWLFDNVCCTQMHSRQSAVLPFMPSGTDNLAGVLDFQIAICPAQCAAAAPNLKKCLVWVKFLSAAIIG